MQFTQEQTLAIERRRGELLLDAGAGSGKTSVLVERFVRAVQEDGIGVAQILTITFTEKAAAELRERIRGRLSEAGEDGAARATEGAWISTIHAFCARLLRTHALDAGLDPEFTVLDERETAPLRRAAFDAALAAVAGSPEGSELISAFGPATLRANIAATYAELRARGELEPRLPPAPPPPNPLDLRSACLLVEDLALVVGQELGAIRDPGRRVIEAIELLDRVPAILESGKPWPGQLERIKLGANAGALKSQACDDYREALAELLEMAGENAVTAARDGLDRLLREYGTRYTELKRASSALDFTDLELLARELLRSEEIGTRYRERFTRVMVDEMQDTNRVQLELIDLVTQLDLVMVGDAQQSIYGFRHANVELFEERGRRLERIGARASLQTNFRSCAEILRALNGAFAAALGESYRPLTPGRVEEPAAGPLVELLIADRDSTVPDPDPAVEQLAAPWRVAEARALAARVRELIDTGQARAADVVVLLRATTDIHVYEQSLEAAGVPTYVIGGRGYWSHPQVIELVAYLRALANPLDAESLYAVFLSPLCGLSLDGLVLRAAGAADELAIDDRERLREFDDWFAAERRAAAWLGPEELLDRALARNGYELQIAGLPDARRRLANVRKLMRLAREWQVEHGSDLRGFVDLLVSRADGSDGARESEAPVESEALDAVRLMTIHRSKGLEFPVVCVADIGRQVMPRAGALIRIGRDDDRLGLRLKQPGDGQRVSVLAYDALKLEEREREAEEERRLFYVAMTRAKERLIVSGAARLENWDQANRLAPVGWIGRAFVPDIATRAAAASALMGPDDRVEPEPFVTDLGVLVRFLSASTTVATPPYQPSGVDEVDAPPDEPPRVGAPPHEPPPVDAPPHEPPRVGAAPDEPPRVGAGGVLHPHGAKPFPGTAEPWLAGPRPQPRSLSYTALATYEQCGYRFYVQRVLGLPDLPNPDLPPQEGERVAPATPATPATPPPPPGRGGLTAAQRGTLIHQVLAGMDLRNPSLREAMPTDVRGLLAGLIGSSTFARLAGLRDVSREQRFSFPVGETLITGVFDVIAQEGPGQLLVIDYKSDRLGGADPATVVADRYLTQRLIYALAALKLGAPSVEVIHLFLEAPEDPVWELFHAADIGDLEVRLAERVAGPLAGDFRVSDTPGPRICDGCPAQGGLCSHPLERTLRG
jgi:ATP-dependent exoDNAse (exonuclease V) beta subunit